MAYHLAIDMFPLNATEKEGFKRLLKTIDPKYELPGHKYFLKQALPTLYNEVLDGLSQKLLHATYFSTTTDL